MIITSRDNHLVTIDDLKNIVKDFIDNNGDSSCNYCNGSKSEKASDNPKKAVISLQNGEQTSYNTFIAVQDKLTTAYFELRATYSVNVYEKTFEDLNSEQLSALKKAYPFILSEAETK
ncbi:hypothetical protein [Changchengzhania lutea]|uniref:hypothetical protein n=1 Tax=Changchengzhania lutea TaxID=2049305 RepID=UPI00163DA8FD|nr:hypothetical protein [Changchengzhania lutea]